MIGKIEKNPQLEIFKIPLKHFIEENYDTGITVKEDQQGRVGIRVGYLSLWEVKAGFAFLSGPSQE